MQHLIIVSAATRNIQTKHNSCFNINTYCILTTCRMYHVGPVGFLKKKDYFLKIINL